jgi:hypothetical protein
MDRMGRHVRSGDYEDLQVIAKSLPDNSKVIVARNPGLARRWSEPGNYVHGRNIRGAICPGFWFRWRMPIFRRFSPSAGNSRCVLLPRFSLLSSPSSIPT